MEKSTIKKLVFGVLIVSALSLATWYLVPKIKDALDKNGDDEGTPDPADPNGGKGDDPSKPKPTNTTAATVGGKWGDNEGWSPKYYLSVPSKVKVNKETAVKIVTQIYNANGGTWGDDDEDAVTAALNQLQTRADLSFVSELFYRQYNKDLLIYLKGFMPLDMWKYVYSVTDKLK